MDVTNPLSQLPDHLRVDQHPQCKKLRDLEPGTLGYASPLAIRIDSGWQVWVDPNALLPLARWDLSGFPILLRKHSQGLDEGFEASFVRVPESQKWSKSEMGPDDFKAAGFMRVMRFF
jgi:hypothetical protein